ncbi:MAG TPA: pilus assembly protein TadG-related protein [Longimicrobiales bacterium]|nr:pilus assembly protein TadG-related protein [Longimicrobiales bacterium]
MAIFAGLALAFLMTIGALAVDGGSIVSARSDARQAADAAALAGASAFVDAMSPATATARATDFATKNYIHGAKIIASEVTVRVVDDSAKVYVTIERPNVPLWFGRALGFNTYKVKVTSAAGTRAGTSARCVKPFAPPDLWADQDDDTNHNKIPDAGEVWQYDPSLGDYYRTVGGRTPANKPPTGYGSNYRGQFRDVGTQIQLRSMGSSGFDNNRYYTWVMPTDGNMSQNCRFHQNGSDNSANAFRANICNCNNSKITVGTTYTVDQGNRSGPLNQGIDELINLDPNAYWDVANKRVANSAFSPWQNSPRIVKIPLFAPNDPGSGGVKFIAFQVVFVESQANASAPIVGRVVNIVREVRLIQ